MFYCDACADVRGWPETFFHSRGKCEVCGEVGICNDTPSKNLPPLPDSPSQAEVDAAIASIKEVGE